ncbi:DUF2062 domain-containing protein [Halopenitus sp. POP-27]|uniref:DUF2062 domain-containing protein n=1 Tax=Halopenitus sp. POP-27 TaxID=2994425 RepID=UPI002468B111|nr:DUF2062 domain-containing protein [Halopenitus sp. POP-27]
MLSIRSRTGAWTHRIRSGLHDAFAETHTPREIAGSFSFGVFVTMLPTLGVGLLLFALLVWLFDGVSKLAFVAAVLLVNPLVKSGVYVVSFAIGVIVLGPIEGANVGTIGVAALSSSAGREIAVRLLVGNVILSVATIVPSYVICFRLVEAYRARDVAIVEEIESVVAPEADPE